MVNSSITYSWSQPRKFVVTLRHSNTTLSVIKQVTSDYVEGLKEKELKIDSWLARSARRLPIAMSKVL